jgi:hypothetical protein
MSQLEAMTTVFPSIEYRKNQLQKNPSQEPVCYLNQGGTFRIHQNHCADAVDRRDCHSNPFLQIPEGRIPSNNGSWPAAKQPKPQVPQCTGAISPGANYTAS